MRISTKVSLGLTAVGLVVFGGIGVVQITAEKRDLEDAFVKEAIILCRATVESLRQDVREHAPEDTEALMQTLEQTEGLDAALWWSASPQPGVDAEKSSAIDALARDAIATGRIATRIFTPRDGSRVAIVAGAIDPHHGPPVVVLVRPLDQVDADLRREAEVTALSVIAFSILGGLFGFVLGERLIRRPLARLGKAMSDIAAGDLRGSLLPGRADEIGVLLGHFESMRRELQRARDHLEEEQQAHRATLERLALADRLVTIGQLAAGLAHEIGSPLQVLHGRAAKLAEHLGPEHELRRSVDLIAEQTERITRIVHQLLEFARPRAQESRPTDPVTCVGAVVDLLGIEASRRRGTVRLVTDPMSADRVDIDGDALQQIVFNLARNGLAALEPGGCVEIRLALVDGRRGARRLRLLVCDNGRGMPDEVRAHIFEPFFTTRGHDGGVGLGLAVVRSLVERMHGTISVTHRSEGGTEFTVELPC